MFDKPTHICYVFSIVSLTLLKRYVNIILVMKITKKVIHEIVKKPSVKVTRFFPYLSNCFSINNIINKAIVFCIPFMK